MSLVTTDSEVERICLDLLALSTADAIGIDTETTGLALWTDDVVRGVCLSYGDRGYYVPVSHPDSQNVSEAAASRLAQAVQHSPALHVWHNAIFDWTAMSQLGFAPRYEHFWDTQVVSWCMDENTSHRLKDLGAAIFGEDAKAEQAALKRLFRGVSASDIYKTLRYEGWPVQAAKLESKDLAQASRKTWGTVTASDIAEYAAKDAVLTRRLFEWQCKQLASGDLRGNPRPDIARQFAVLAMTHRMIVRGVPVDLDDVRAKRARNLARIWEIEPTFDGVNLNSPKQLGALVYDTWGLPCSHYTKTGARSTAREALEELDGAHPDLTLLLEFRKLSKVVSTYYDALIARTDSAGRIHPGLNPNGTTTGRYTCQAPNMQNIPREDTNPEVKKVFRAEPGMELWEFDLKSAELYVGGSVADDTEMLDALDSPGRDFHTETAVALFGYSDGATRTTAKNLNYGIPYGIGPAKFATYLVKGTGRPIQVCNRCQAAKFKECWPPNHPVPGCDECFARSLIRKHKMAWPKTHRAMALLTEYARDRGILPHTQEGRFRRFRSAGRFVSYYTAFNAVVQGGVSDLMKNWMLAVEGPLADCGAYMCLQVHDSLWVQLPEGASDTVAALLQDRLDSVNPYQARLTLDGKRLS